MIIEIYRANVKKYGAAAVRRKKLYIEWTPEKIKKAFNFGNGTQKEFARYQEANKKYCVFVEV